MQTHPHGVLQPRTRFSRLASNLLTQIAVSHLGHPPRVRVETVPGKGSRKPPHDTASMQQSRFQRQRAFLRYRCPRSMIRSYNRRHKSKPASVDLPRRARDDRWRCRGDFHSHAYRCRSHGRARVWGELLPVPRYSNRGNLPRHWCSGSTSPRRQSRGSIRTCK